MALCSTDDPPFRLPSDLGTVICHMFVSIHLFFDVPAAWNQGPNYGSVPDFFSRVARSASGSLLFSTQHVALGITDIGFGSTDATVLVHKSAPWADGKCFVKHDASRGSAL